MEPDVAATEKRMKLRYPGDCRVCGVALAARQEAVYERGSGSVRCLECPRGSVVEVRAQRASEPPSRAQADADASGTAPEQVHQNGTAGASARREYERRRATREERTRSRHPRLGGLILALSDEPQSTRAWASGAEGEAALGARLDRQASERIAVLHDRRIPGTRANIDHVVVTSGGVFVVDAKRYVDQRPELRVDGGILRPRVEHLTVGRRDRTRLVEGVLAQLERVKAALEDPLVEVHGVLCFIEADWPLIGPWFSVRGVRVLSPRRLSRVLAEAAGGFYAPAVRDRVAEAFPPA